MRPVNPGRVSMLTNGGRPVLRCEGEFDLGSSAELIDELDRAADEGFQRVLVDLDGATFLDSYALATIVRAHQRLEHRGGGLTIAVGVGQPRKLLELTSIDEYIPVVEPSAEAFGSR
jgi:anti-anti-sigma factor